MSEDKQENFGNECCSTAMPCYAFGQRVSFTHKLKRIITSRRLTTHSGIEYTLHNWKVWEQEPYDCRGAIFLGIRTLKNGTREFDNEYGWSFNPKEYFKAALICPTDKINPVFVPLDCIEA